MFCETLVLVVPLLFFMRVSGARWMGGRAGRAGPGRGRGGAGRGGAGRMAQLVLDC